VITSRSRPSRENSATRLSIVMTSEKSHDLVLFKEIAEEFRKESLNKTRFDRTKYLVSKLDEDIKGSTTFPRQACIANVRRLAERRQSEGSNETLVEADQHGNDRWGISHSTNAC
jgi:hypothetical protein